MISASFLLCVRENQKETEHSESEAEFKTENDDFTETALSQVI